MAGECGFFMSTWSSPRIQFTKSLSRSTSIRKILSSRDATVMIWMFPVFTASCSVTFVFSCFRGRLDNTVLAAKITRMRPSAAVDDDSVGSTSVSPSRNVLVSRSSPVTTNFTIGCFSFVFSQCVSKHQARRSPAKSHPIRLEHPRMIAIRRLRSVYRRFKSEHQVL